MTSYRREISRIKAEEAKEREEKLEKKRKREVEVETAKIEKEAKRQKRQAISFDFTRDFLTQRDAVYCGKCNKVFTSIETRDSHERKHDDPKNFICGKCDKKFKKMDNKDFHEAHCRKKRDVSADDDENDDEVYSLIQSLLGDASKLYRLKFAKGIRNLFSRLEKALAEASDQLFTIQRKNETVKYFISLHCMFYKATDPDVTTDPPIVFNSGSSMLLAGSNVKEQMEIKTRNLIQSIETYQENGSDWVLLHLVYLDIGTIRYKPC